METARIRELCLAAEAACGGGELARALVLTDAALSAARQCCRGLVATTPHHALGLSLTADGWVRRSIGDSRLARGRFEEALVVGRALAQLDPEHALAILTHAARYLRAENRDEDLSSARALEKECLALLGEALGTDHLRYFKWREAVNAGVAPP